MTLMQFSGLLVVWLLSTLFIETRNVVVRIEANEKGVITDAQITRSSGVPALDQKILRAVRSAKFKPYKENGVAYPIRAEQPFELTLNPNG